MHHTFGRQNTWIAMAECSGSSNYNSLKSDVKVRYVKKNSVQWPFSYWWPLLKWKQGKIQLWHVFLTAHQVRTHLHSSPTLSADPVHSHKNNFCHKLFLSHTCNTPAPVTGQKPALQSGQELWRLECHRLMTTVAAGHWLKQWPVPPLSSSHKRDELKHLRQSSKYCHFFDFVLIIKILCSLDRYTHKILQIKINVASL